MYLLRGMTLLWGKKTGQALSLARHSLGVQGVNFPYLLQNSLASLSKLFPGVAQMQSRRRSNPNLRNLEFAGAFPLSFG